MRMVLTLNLPSLEHLQLNLATFRTKGELDINVSNKMQIDFCRLVCYSNIYLFFKILQWFTEFIVIKIQRDLMH